MRITLEKGKIHEPQEYHVETTVQIPKDVLESYGFKETGFSPNPFDPVIVYNASVGICNLQHFIDYIIDREKRG